MQRPFSSSRVVRQQPRICAPGVSYASRNTAKDHADPARRSLLALLLSAPAVLHSEPAVALAVNGQLKNDTLAYQFSYPTATASGREIPLTFSREPERYSSAAPLTADARQRMVAGLASLGDGITIGVFVGPASGALKEKGAAEWTPRLVASTVLTDRSAARNTQGQRVPLAAVESARSEERDGVTYYVYEALQQGSPNLFDQSSATFRRSLCVTASRANQAGEQYLYTLALSCPANIWDDVKSGFQEAAASFKLLTPGKNYVSPEQEAWRFF